VIARPEQVQADLLADSDITGIFCCHDIGTVQILGRLKEQGVRIPQDINLVSYGNTDLARYFTPAITAIDPHHSEMVDHLITLLEPGMKDGRVEKQQFIAQPDLVVRET
jgi:DNA-binding LacI/PurR family transcriptional regulator